VDLLSLRRSAVFDRSTYSRPSLLRCRGKPLLESVEDEAESEQELLIVAESVLGDVVEHLGGGRMGVGPGAALTELAVGDASPLVAGIEAQRPFLQCVAIDVGVLDGLGMDGLRD
jgi:hypothetical protein